MRLLFCNIARMDYYKGIFPGVDEPQFGGSYVDQTGDAYEKYNFEPINIHFEDGSLPDGQYCLGFVETKSSKDGQNQLYIERIEGCQDMTGEESVDDVLVIFCAKRPPHGFTSVVGWYKHATVYRNYLEADFSSAQGGVIYKQYYNIIAKKSDCVLLPSPARKGYEWNVPSRQKGAEIGFGQSNIWFAEEDTPLLEGYLKKLVREIKQYSDENWLEVYPLKQMDGRGLRGKIETANIASFHDTQNTLAHGLDSEASDVFVEEDLGEEVVDEEVVAVNLDDAMKPKTEANIKTADFREKYWMIKDNHYDLQELLEEVQKMFPLLKTDGLVKLAWSESVEKSWFGLCVREPQEGGDVYKIYINRVLSSPRVDREVIKYLIYHELLHLNGDWRHDEEFRKKEWQYPNSAELDGNLDYLTFRYDMDEVMKNAVNSGMHWKNEPPEEAAGEMTDEGTEVPTGLKDDTEKQPLPPGVQPGYKYCRNCGNKLPVSANFCNECGERLDY